jgi:hypothetical protein
MYNIKKLYKALSEAVAIEIDSEYHTINYFNEDELILSTSYFDDYNEDREIKISELLTKKLKLYKLTEIKENDLL